MEHESEQFEQRLADLQETLADMIENAAGDAIFSDIARTGTIINQVLNDLIDLIDWIKEKCELLENELKTKPIEIVEFVTSTEISITPLLDLPRSYLVEIQELTNGLVEGISGLITDQIPTLLEGGKDAFIDAVVDELIEHYNIVETNKETILDQLVTYEELVSSVATNFHKVDQNVGHAIKSRTGMDTSIDGIERVKEVTLEDSRYLDEGLNIRQTQFENAHALFSSLLNGVVLAITEIIRGFIIKLNIALVAVLTGIDGATNLALHGNPVGPVLSIFTDFDEKVRDLVEKIKKPIENVISTVDGIDSALQSLEANLPEVIENFKPYLLNTIFNPSAFSNINLYNIAAQAIFDDMEILFKDIIYQLSGSQKGFAIQGTVDASENIRDNLSIINEQVERMT